MIKIAASDELILHVGLERSNATNESDLDGIAELLIAIDELTQGWLAPLGAAFQLVCCDPNDYFEEVGLPSAPHYFLRQTDIPGDIYMSEVFRDASRAELSLLDNGAIVSAIKHGLEQPAPAGAVVSLSQLVWPAVRVRSPTSEPIALELGPFSVPTVSVVHDGGLWYAGPTGWAAGAPARLHAYNYHFSTRISLDICWDLWIGHSDGRALLDAGIRRVLDRPGWERSGKAS